MSITQIATNYEALFANKMVAQMSSKASSAMSHIASGQRIVSAADDPVGVGMLSSFEAKMSGAHTVQRGLQDGLELAKFCDSVLAGLEDTMIEMQAIAIRVGNDATLSTTQTTALIAEYAAIAEAGKTTVMSSLTWNGKIVADGATLAATPNVVTDLKGTQLDITSILAAASAAAWNLSTLTVNTTLANAAAGATEAAALDADLATVGGYRAEFGTLIKTLEAALDTAVTAELNYASSVSAIGDADIAAEVTAMASAQVLAQAGTAMIAQANMSSQIVLGLLG